ncbi:hypothetical protein VPH35_009829 [Triticum aestivum]
MKKKESSSRLASETTCFMCWTFGSVLLLSFKALAWSLRKLHVDSNQASLVRCSALLLLCMFHSISAAKEFTSVLWLSFIYCKSCWNPALSLSLRPFWQGPSALFRR